MIKSVCNVPLYIQQTPWSSLHPLTGKKKSEDWLMLDYSPTKERSERVFKETEEVAHQRGVGPNTFVGAFYANRPINNPQGQTALDALKALTEYHSYLTNTCGINWYRVRSVWVEVLENREVPAVVRNN